MRQDLDYFERQAVSEFSFFALSIIISLFLSHFIANAFASNFRMEKESELLLICLAAVVSRWSGSRKHLEAERPEFHAALLRIEAHPKIAPVFAQHWPTT